MIVTEEHVWQHTRCPSSTIKESYAITESTEP